MATAGSRMRNEGARGRGKKTRYRLAGNGFGSVSRFGG